jgi:hypothetical protein
MYNIKYISVMYCIKHKIIVKQEAYEALFRFVVLTSSVLTSSTCSQ